MIPEFLGLPADGSKPWAEMWMGNHSGACSALNAQDEYTELRKAADTELSFLFKLLAADKPLSIQAHPNKEQAQEGFLKEERSGAALNDPCRNYTGSNHKPEILCAISPFTIMAGFKTPLEIKSSLEPFLSIPDIKDIFLILIRALEEKKLSGFFSALSCLSEEQTQRISFFIRENESAGAVLPPEKNDLQRELMRKFSDSYPDDPAVISPLFLNLFTLEPGQGIFIPAGALHSYIKGFGIELMANSDNVLRGGLTRKHKDMDELKKILNYSPYMPEIITPPSSSRYFCYPFPISEISLSMLCAGQRGTEHGAREKFPAEGPAICLVTEGRLHISGEEGIDAVFRKGESFFIWQDRRQLFYDGNFSLYMANGT